MKRDEKQAFIAEMKGRLEKAPGAVAADFRGLDMESITELRRKMRAESVDFRVVKNTLTRRAAEGTPLAPLVSLLEGPTALAVHPEDPTIPARILSEFARSHEALKIKGGVLVGRLLNPREVEALARLPRRPQMLALLAGVLMAGPQKMAALLAAGPRRMAGLILALKEKQASASA
ncbi:MAG: 50S ribosomal protein L10 [Deltaproteobacteria bacterium RBG_13_61_14]|nr:MAG: 50S ribosomal protein L10 [Deltaproteobacteria bacterium RBG_13_61_14]